MANLHITVHTRAAELDTIILAYNCNLLNRRLFSSLPLHAAKAELRSIVAGEQLAQNVEQSSKNPNRDIEDLDGLAGAVLRKQYIDVGSTELGFLLSEAWEKVASRVIKSRLSANKHSVTASL